MSYGQIFRRHGNGTPDSEILAFKASSTGFSPCGDGNERKNLSKAIRGRGSVMHSLPRKVPVAIPHELAPSAKGHCT